MRLWPLYADLGRLRQAQRIVHMIRPSDPTDMYWFVADMAEAGLLYGSGQQDRLTEFLAVRARDALPENAPPYMGGRKVLLIEAGLLDLAERDHAWIKRRTNLTGVALPFYLIDSGRLALKRGRPGAAIALLREATALPAAKHIGGQTLWAASTLATALDQVGNRSEAIKVLQDAVSTRLSALGPAHDASGIVSWMQASAQLAQLYREDGQAERARPIEDDLLKFLALADPDYPLLRQIRARQ